MRMIQDKSFSIFHILIIVIAGLILTLPAFYNSYIAGHDYLFHVIFSHQFSEQFIHGELYPRWMSSMNAGFGSPTFFFYAPLPYYITSIFSLFSSMDHDDGTLALVFSASLALIASGITAYFWLKEFSGKRNAMFIAIIYMLLPYHFVVDFYIRFAFAELWAFVWMPLILLFSIKTTEVRKNAIIFLTLGMSLLIFTHLPTFIIFMPFFLGHFLLVTDKSQRRVVYIKHFIAIALAVGLSAIYWVPAMMTQDNVSMEYMRTGMFLYSNNFLLNGPKINHSYVFWRYLAFISVLTCGLACGAWMSSKGRVNFQKRKEVNYWIAAVLLSFFMMFSISQFIWDISPPLQRVQFPWRFNTILSLATVTVLALATSEQKNNKTNTGSRKSLIICFLLVGILIISELIYGFDPIFNNRMDKEDIIDSLITSSSPGEYRPRWVPEDIFELDDLDQFSANIQKIQGDKKNIHWKIETWLPRLIVFKITTAEKSNLIIHQFYYQGWTAVSDRRPFQLTVKPSEQGLLELDVPEGQQKIMLTLQAFPEEKAGVWISSVSFLFLLLLGWKGMFDNKERT